MLAWNQDNVVLDEGNGLCKRSNLTSSLVVSKHGCKADGERKSRDEN